MTKKPEGPFKVTADVFGIYTHGQRRGKTNPKAVATIVMFGETVTEAMGKLNVQSDGALYKIKEVATTRRQTNA